MIRQSAAAAALCSALALSACGSTVPTGPGAVVNGLASSGGPGSGLGTDGGVSGVDPVTGAPLAPDADLPPNSNGLAGGPAAPGSVGELAGPDRGSGQSPTFAGRDTSQEAPARSTAPISIGVVSNAPAIASATSSAILKWRGSRDRVMFLTTFSLVPVTFMQQAEQQGYRPRYGLASGATPQLLKDNVSPNQLKGALGVGIDPTFDSDARSWRVDPPGRASCVALLKKAGMTFTKGSPADGAAMNTCDMLLLLKAGADLAAAGESVPGRETLTHGLTLLGSTSRPPAHTAPGLLRSAAQPAPGSSDSPSTSQEQTDQMYAADVASRSLGIVITDVAAGRATATMTVRHPRETRPDTGRHEIVARTS